VYPAGHAIEVRIYAEDPANDFLPSVGKILRWFPPADVRVDAGVRSGDEVSVYYDPMVAKIIAYGEHRDGAIRRLDYALSQLQLLGLRSNIAFLRRLLTHPDHLVGNITTGFIPLHPELLREDSTPPAALIAAALAQLTTERTNETLPALSHHWRNNPFRPIRQRFRHANQTVELLLTPQADNRYNVMIDNQAHEVRVWQQDVEAISLSVDGRRQHVTVVRGAGIQWWVHANGHTSMLEWLDPLPASMQSRSAAGSLRAPMPGQIRAVNVSSGQTVNAGDVLVILEAMKMEHRIEAPHDGLVVAVHFQVGQSVAADAVLLDLSPLETA
jgi:acetyl/propionyl-CoA carboxylase alpha subunit